MCGKNIDLTLFSKTLLNRTRVRSKLYYRVMADVMNHTYREPMTVEQMGLYMYESGFNILRYGYIKVHNGLVCQPR